MRAIVVGSSAQPGHGAGRTFLSDLGHRVGPGVRLAAVPERVVLGQLVGRVVVDVVDNRR